MVLMWRQNMNHWRNRGTNAVSMAPILKMCLWVSGITRSCLLEVVDVYNELNLTTAALGEQGAWEQLP